MQTRIDRRENRSGLAAVGALVGLLLFSAASCKKSAPPKPIPITPLQAFVNSDTSLTLFHAMLLTANDAALLADDSVTLLIPTNAVLLQAGYTQMIIDSSGASFLDRMLRYQYILSGHIATDSGSYTAYPTLLGDSLYIEKDSAGQLLFNASATAANSPIVVGKASIYYLNTLLPSASDSLPVLLQSDTSLSLLAEAFTLTNVYDSLLLSGNYTLLAPVNSAFEQAGYDSTNIDSANVGTLIQLLQGQVLKGIYFTNGFPGSGTLSDLLGNPVTIGHAGGGLQFSASGNTVPVNWLSGNLVVGPGLVVHRTDQFLTP